MLELSSDAGLAAAFLITGNLLLGLLLSVRRWRQRPVLYARIHDWMGYVVLVAVGLHVVLLVAAKQAGMGLAQVLWPVRTPEQPVVNTLGAIALYLLLVVVVTSWLRRRMRRGVWKAIHLSAYVMAGLFLVHGVLSDTTLKHRPVDLLDGEKVALEACGAAVALAAVGRVAHALRPGVRAGASRAAAVPQDAA